MTKATDLTGQLSFILFNFVYMLADPAIIMASNSSWDLMFFWEQLVYSVVGKLIFLISPDEWDIIFPFMGPYKINQQIHF